MIAAPAPPLQLPRRLDPNLHEMLGNFAPLVSEGRATLICLDAIIEGLGTRWDARRESVHEHVERTIARYLGPHGFQLRLSDSDILIGQPELGPLSGQATALRCLREILTHFLGDGHLAGQGVFEVVRIADGELHVAPIDPLKAEAGERSEMHAGGPATAVKAGAGPWLRTLSLGKREIEISCVAQTFLELRHVQPIGFRLVRYARVVSTGRHLAREYLARLKPSDRLAVERIGLELSLEALREIARRGGPPPIMVLPMSCAVLTTSRGRSLALASLRQAADLCRNGVVCEIEDLGGVPQVTLVGVISAVKRSVMLVAGSATDLPTWALPHLRGVGFKALTLEAPRGPRSDAAEWMGDYIGAAKRSGFPAWIHGLRSIEDLALAAQLGASHASFCANEMADQRDQSNTTWLEV